MLQPHRRGRCVLPAPALSTVSQLHQAPRPQPLSGYHHCSPKQLKNSHSPQRPVPLFVLCVTQRPCTKRSGQGWLRDACCSHGKHQNTRTPLSPPPVVPARPASPRAPCASLQCRGRVALGNCVTSRLALPQAKLPDRRDVHLDGPGALPCTGHVSSRLVDK